MLPQFVTLLVVLASASCQNVVIIGAGPSGIAAATRLLDEGFNVTVLEAEDRIGGRIRSVWFGEGYVDLGAQFLHGEKDNIVYDIVDGLDLVQHTEMKFELQSSDGASISEELRNTLWAVMKEILGDSSGQMEGVFLEDHIREKYAEKVQNIFKNDPRNLKIALAAAETFTRALLSIHPTRQKVSAKQDMVIPPGDFNLNWKRNGFKTVLEILLEEHPHFKPHLGVEATKIEWNCSDKKVRVYCSGGKVFKADHVIYTGSLGVLKADHKKLFAPRLSQKKVTAIGNMGFGVVMKGMLEFKERWWAGALPAMFVWKNRNSWISDLTWAIELPDNPNVLMLWITGKYVPQIEKLSDKEFTDQIMQALRMFFVAMHQKSNWWTNPHFRGAYSFETPESRSQEISSHSILAEPLVQNGVPKVLFAGEATHPTFYASVHGAIETGYAVADSLMEIY